MTKKITFSNELDYEIAKAIIEDIELMESGYNELTGIYELKIKGKSGNELIIELSKPKVK